jgi:hypothetical protein
MDYLYSLYDALVSINVPNDKARAVVDAMERDMATTIATKADLQLLKADVQAVRQELRSELQLIRQEMATKADLAQLRQESALMRKDLDTMSSGLRKDMDAMSAGLRKDMDAMSAAFSKDMEILRTTMTVRLGSMLMLGLGLLFTALKLTA